MDLFQQFTYADVKEGICTPHDFFKQIAQDMGITFYKGPLLHRVVFGFGLNRLDADLWLGLARNYYDQPRIKKILEERGCPPQWRRRHVLIAAHAYCAAAGETINEIYKGNNAAQKQVENTVRVS